jgi:hypothetical protein
MSDKDQKNKAEKEVKSADQSAQQQTNEDGNKKGSAEKTAPSKTMAIRKDNCAEN